ncbi:hypothetical protein P1P68_22270 [Streptomyces scabiei]|uniref:hypothetical protein n=1 Tax=Streptomyces scabiei TaxID=1930 RepID=UPI00298F7308|nr:hypothetical protein [Streptomyces scabiei]MDW8807436.1 hypothetical protein [Streptomyces scabiei]
MSRTTQAGTQLPPEIQRLVDEATAVVMAAADPVAVAHEFARLLPGCLAAVQRAEAGR